MQLICLEFLLPRGVHAIQTSLERSLQFHNKRHSLNHSRYSIDIVKVFTQNKEGMMRSSLSVRAFNQ